MMANLNLNVALQSSVDSRRMVNNAISCISGKDFRKICRVNHDSAYEKK